MPTLANSHGKGSLTIVGTAIDTPHHQITFRIQANRVASGGFQP